MNRLKITFGLWLLTAVCFFSPGASAQYNEIVDSLILEVKALRLKPESFSNDTHKVNQLVLLAWEMKYINVDTAILLNGQAYKIAEKHQWKKGIAKSLGNFGNCYHLKADYPKALYYYLEALKMDEIMLGEAEELNELATANSGKAKRMGSIGLVYSNMGDYPKALEFYIKALKLNETLDNKTEIARNLGNIGGLYFLQEDYAKALEYYDRALKLDEALANKNGMTIRLGNIGLTYTHMNDHARALAFYSKGLKIAQELENKYHIGFFHGNIGSVYRELSHKGPTDSLNALALENFFIALKISEGLGDKNGVARLFANIGTLYTSTGKYPDAEHYLVRAVEIQDSLGGLNELRQYEELLSNLYNITGRHQLAMLHYKKSMALKDTIFNRENRKQLVQKEMNYEFEKKEAAAKVEQEKKDAITRIIIVSVSAGFLLVLVLAVFIFRSYRQKQRANLLISQQKALVEEKQKEILDSIHYARRIQNSLLPKEAYIGRCMRKLMVLPLFISLVAYPAATIRVYFSGTVSSENERLKDKIAGLYLFVKGDHKFITGTYIKSNGNYDIDFLPEGQKIFDFFITGNGFDTSFLKTYKIFESDDIAWNIKLIPSGTGVKTWAMISTGLFILKDGEVLKQGMLLRPHQKILFDFDKATILPMSMGLLDSIAEFLKVNVNKGLVVEVGNHTDTRWSKELSFCLSCARAKAVADYLISNGIPPERLTSKGYNDTNPIIPKSEIDKMKTKEEQEKAHQVNRRTEFKILRTDYN